MRVGIDFHLAEREGTGNCTYMRNLVESLVELDSRNTYLLYVTDSSYPYFRVFDRYPHVAFRSLGVSNPLLRIPLLGLRTFIDRTDILHANYYGPPFFRGKLILTVHDLSFLSIPECFSTFERVKDEILIPHNVKRAFKVMTVSEFSKQDIVNNYHIEPERVEVGYNGASPLFRPVGDEAAARKTVEGYGVSGPYILYVGRLNKRKNLRSLVAAYGVLKSEKAIPHRLVVGGIRDFLPPDEMEEIDRSPWRDEIVFTGFLPDEDLPSFYGMADVFVYPSLYEGFGLPCLEAMSSGCPVISSDLTSLPEVVGDAGILLNPMDVKGLADAIYRVVSDAGLREAMKTRGFEQATKFSWKKTAMKMLEISEEVRTRRAAQGHHDGPRTNENT